MSVLRPETVALLRKVHEAAPLFSNLIAAELFDAAHTRGTLTLLPSMTGGYILFDTTAPLNAGVLGRFPTLERAHAALEAAAVGPKGPRRVAA
jgi:hypothetical protein